MRAFNDLVAAQALGLEPEDIVSAEPGYTGRYLVLLQEGAIEEGSAVMSAADINTIGASQLDDGYVASELLKTLGAVVFENIGVALVDASPEQLAQVQAASAGASPILAIEPERICTTSDGSEELSLDYLRGFRDAVRDLAGRLTGGPVTPPSAPPLFDESVYTWGVQAVGADHTDASGEKVRVAVLDTGLFDAHPDLAGRTVHSNPS